jgi:hypothetical protein
MPSPRTYEKLSRIIDTIERVGAASEVEYGMVTGCIGEGVGLEYLAFKRIANSLVSPDQIILNPMKAPVPDLQDSNGPAAMYALVTGLARKATDKSITSILTYLDRIPSDYQVVCVSDILARQPELVNTRGMLEWASKNADIIH